MSAPLPTDPSTQMQNNIFQPKSEPIDTHSQLGAPAMQPQRSAPPARLILRSTVLNMDPPLHTVPALGALPGTSIPPEMYQQLGMLPGNNTATITADAGDGGFFNSTGVSGYGGLDLLFPGVNHAQMDSIFPMAGVPIPGHHQLTDPLLQPHQQEGPSSETARKEAAAAARAARQAKRREEKQKKKEERTRKTSIVPVAELQPRATTIFVPAVLLGATAQAPNAAGVTHHPQPSTSQQPPRSFSRRERGKKTSAASGNKSEQRAMKNRESAARSRAKRVEYTSALEAQIEQLRTQNKTLRTRVITSVAAPPDPHAGKVDGKPLRRTRTMPL